jgi:integrase
MFPPTDDASFANTGATDATASVATALGAAISDVAAASAAMLADLQLSPLTKTTYRQGLKAFARFLRADDDCAPSEAEPAQTETLPLALIDEETLASFVRWLRATYPDPHLAADDPAVASITRTARTYLVAARRLMNWLDLHALLPDGVSYDRMVRRIDQGRGHRRQGYRQRKVDPDVLQVLNHYLRQPLPEKPLYRRLALLRNRALMVMLYDTGMRISEALALTREDVLDGRAKKVRLTRTKNGKPRTVFLSEDSRRVLRAYVRERGDSPYAPLFVSHGRGKGGALSPSHAWLVVKNAAQAEGLYQGTSPHSLRHRRAQDLLDEGMPLEWVAALLGHQHPDTTRVVYAWHTDEERLADMVATYGLSPDEARKKVVDSKEE